MDQETTILMRLSTLETDMKDVKRTLGEVRDHQISHPLCSRPNTCIELIRILDGHAEAIRRLEKAEVRIVTICALITFGLPLLLAWINSR